MNGNAMKTTVGLRVRTGVFAVVFRLSKLLILQIGVICAGVPAIAGETPSPPVGCAAPEYHQFDFWIGAWTIKQKILQADGGWFEADATTKVSPILDGCALMEEWQGEVLFFWEGMKKTEAMTGFSLRAFDPLTKRWVLSWMDSRHHRLAEFEGVFRDGRGEFFRKQPGKDGQETTTRITFSNITPLSVHWDLAVKSARASDWKTLWIMEMSRPSATAKTGVPNSADLYSLGDTSPRS